MTVDDLLDGHFMDENENEEEDDIDQVSPELLYRLTRVNLSEYARAGGIRRRRRGFF